MNETGPWRRKSHQGKDSQEAVVEPPVMNSPACEDGGGGSPVGGR